jgi:hypothetical protein
LPVIPPDVVSARMADLTAVVAQRGLCTDFGRFSTDAEYRDRWNPASEPGASAVRERESYVAAARAVCVGAGCPVVAPCLEMTLRLETGRGRASHGIAGGTAPWERRSLIRQRSRAAARAAEPAGVAS